MKHTLDMATERPKSRKPPRSHARSSSPWTNAEVHQIVRAIRSGTIDAFVTAETNGEKVLILQGAEHPYRLMVEAVNDGAATLDLSGTVLFANPRFAEILETTVEDVIASSLGEHILGPEFEQLRTLIGETYKNQEKREVVLEAINGRPRIVRLILCPTGPSESTNVCIVATELTELHEANRALINNEESLRQLSARLLRLQDEERRHIARDLHDITGQKLTLQSLELSQILKAESRRLSAKSRKMLADCAALTKEVGAEIRTLSYLLHPPLLDELGLPSAVRWYAEGFQKRTSIETEIEIPRDLPRLPTDVETSLFRVFQESLTNVHRYSGSPKVRVRIHEVDGEMRLEVLDFGKGMRAVPLSSASEGVSNLGVGIQGMHERMRQLSGRLEISSTPNVGTQVVATIPILRREQDADQASGAAAPRPEAEGTRRPEPAKIPGARKRILIADDHEMLRHGVRALLETGADWEICGEAVNGKDAVEKTEFLKPDLVILDVNMPLLNGLAATRQILHDSPQTKVLVFTVHDSDQAKQEIQATGAHGYLSKNRAGQDLLRVVQELLAGGDLSMVPSGA